MSQRHGLVLPAFALILATVAYAANDVRAADQTPTGKGRFQSQKVWFDIGSAFAFRGKATLDKTKDVLIVAVTNADLRPELLGAYFDRKRAIENRVKDEETAVVYFEFSPAGEYRGLSYYFGSGNGCGYCSSPDVASSVKLSGGKLAGSLKDNTEKDRSFDITLDVPIRSDEHGSALPPDGGAPAKAYLAYHEALVKRDAAALKPTLSEGRLRIYARAEKENDLDGYVAYLRQAHPVKSVRVTKGYGTEKNAVLLIEGEGDVGKVTGEVVLLHENGSWHVRDEVVEMALD
jgi:hypothetical protein